MDETPDVSSCGWSLSNIKPLYLVLLHPSPLKVQQTFENPQMEISEFKIQGVFLAGTPLKGPSTKKLI